MAATMGHMSMLPAIKCSNCGADVDLAMMGDHVCTSSTHPAAPPVPNLDDVLPAQPSSSNTVSASDIPPRLHSISPQATSVAPSNVFTTPSGGQRMNLGPVGTAVKPRSPTPPGQADDFFHQPSSYATDTTTAADAPASAGNPYFWQQPASDGAVEGLSASPAATSPASAPETSLYDSSYAHSPLIPSPLSAPAPLDHRPDSAAMFHQYSSEGGFVPTPPEKSKARPRPPPAPLQLSPEGARGEDGLAPLSPVPGGANVIRRLDTLAPGPFDARHRKSDSKDGGSGGGGNNNSSSGKGFSLFRRKSSKRNKASISGPTAIVDAPPLPTPEPGLFVGGNMEKMAMVEQEPRSSKLDNFGQPLPSGPAPPRPARPGAVDPMIEQLRTTDIDAPAEHVARDSFMDGPWNSTESTSQSDQSYRDLNGSFADSATNIAQRPPRVTSDASVYTIVSNPDRSTTFGTELPQIREDEDPDAEADSDTDAPPAWPTGRLRSASRSAENTRVKQDQIPPVPNLHSPDEAHPPQHHTPTESVSSQDSRSVFDDRRESLRSSPPTSTSSSFSPSKQSMDDQRDLNSPGGDGSSAFNRAANFSRPRAPTEPGSQSPPKRFAELTPPASESDESGSQAQEPQQGLSPGPAKLMVPPPRKASLGGLQIPPRSASRRYAGPGTFSDAPPSPMFPQSPMFPPLPQLPAAEKRPGGTRKSSAARSCCRGCDLPIEGKSVKAADGRLTGRYHRECFVCKACKERFATADFYILEDHPYCAQHYHELNGSMCAQCNRGIEGRYIETAGERKHHLYCFTCSECSKPLSQDYFEIDGKFYCEADAGRMHQKSTMLAPGGKFPERRTTRLMMMPAQQ